MKQVCLAACAAWAALLARTHGEACGADGSVTPIYAAGATPPLLDQPYFAGATDKQKLNLYYTSAAEGEGAGAVPLAIFVHGGGWRANDRSVVEERFGSLDLRRYGFSVASLGYRFSNTDQWPAQVDDLLAGVAWLREHAAEHNLDLERFFVYGQSAGGHLSSVLGLGYAQDGHLKAIVDFYGPAGFPLEAMYDEENPFSLLLGCAPAACPEKAETAAPTKQVDARDPPLLIIHGTADPTVPIKQSEDLYAAAMDAGMDVTLLTVSEAGHAMSSVLKPSLSWEVMPEDSPAAQGSDQTDVLLRWLRQRGLVQCEGPEGHSMPTAQECFQRSCQVEYSACRADEACLDMLRTDDASSEAVRANEAAAALVGCGCGACPNAKGLSGLCAALTEEPPSASGATSASSAAFVSNHLAAALVVVAAGGAL